MQLLMERERSKRMKKGANGHEMKNVRHVWTRTVGTNVQMYQRLIKWYPVAKCAGTKTRRIRRIIHTKRYSNWEMIDRRCRCALSCLNPKFLIDVLFGWHGGNHVTSHHTLHFQMNVLMGKACICKYNGCRWALLTKQKTYNCQLGKWNSWMDVKCVISGNVTIMNKCRFVIFPLFGLLQIVLMAFIAYQLLIIVAAVVFD